MLVLTASILILGCDDESLVPDDTNTPQDTRLDTSAGTDTGVDEPTDVDDIGEGSDRREDAGRLYHAGLPRGASGITLGPTDTLVPGLLSYSMVTWSSARSASAL